MSNPGRPVGLIAKTKAKLDLCSARLGVIESEIAELEEHLSTPESSQTDLIRVLEISIGTLTHVVSMINDMAPGIHETEKLRQFRYLERESRIAGEIRRKELHQLNIIKREVSKMTNLLNDRLAEKDDLLEEIEYLGAFLSFLERGAISHNPAHD